MSVHVKDNSLMYRPGPTDVSRTEHAHQVFRARVLTVDNERIVCTIQDVRSRAIYSDVDAVPSHASCLEGTDIQMPEVGSSVLAVPIAYDSGYMQIAILTYVAEGTIRGLGAIATRGPEDVGGYNVRHRSIYRKAYPGQKSATYSGGYTEKIDTGWDRSSRDLSRDKLDPDRREWTRITGRKVSYTDAGVCFTGAVDRDEAAGLQPTMMPDGSQQYPVFLQPGAALTDRYFLGKNDVIQFSEHIERIQEFSLDYPLPVEVLETDLFDEVLGTTSSPWGKTSITKTGTMSHDDQTYGIDQSVDSPYGKAGRLVVGPSTNEGTTPQRRAFIVERSTGTLVGYNRFDKDTYGKVLKPTLFTPTNTTQPKMGRFSANTSSGYAVVVDSADHLEARLAASCHSVRFPHEYNSTRWDITKEGFVSMEIGSTIPKENIGWSGTYEHPHGAGRSLEAHFVGSVKAVIGKNRDEEEAIDLQALGQVVIRLGADDTSLPTSGRTVLTQIRGSKDLVQPRSLQYWTAANRALRNLGDAGSLTNKQAGENISLRGALDGGIVLRVGGRDKNVKRRHIQNGYDISGNYLAPGIPVTPGTPGRLDSKSPDRPTYPPGDSNYQFHDLTTAGQSQLIKSSPPGPFSPYYWSGAPITNMDAQGQSADLHFVRDILLRIGKNEVSQQSLTMDLDGGMVMSVGMDTQKRSFTFSADGGAEIVIGANSQNRGLQLEINGDVNMFVKGNWHQTISGDYVVECTNKLSVTKVNSIETCQNKRVAALGSCVTESPVLGNLEGGNYDKINELNVMGSD